MPGKASLRIFLIAAALIILTEILYALIIWQIIPGAADRGVFGDMFGAVNSLFAGLAFAGVIYTIIAQGSESVANAASAERAARLMAMSALISALSERSRYLESISDQDADKVRGIQASLKALIIELTAELEGSSINSPKST